MLKRKNKNLHVHWPDWDGKLLVGLPKRKRLLEQSIEPAIAMGKLSLLTETLNDEETKNGKRKLPNNESEINLRDSKAPVELSGEEMDDIIKYLMANE
ncbi:hypothetical protein CHUAL_000042 [Chamberlinius hualienensis]